MKKLLPTGDFKSFKLPVVSSKGPWVRIYHKNYTNPLHFGLSRDKKTPGRFDDHDNVYGVLYMGEDAYACFIEIYGDLVDFRIVTEADLADRNMVIIKSKVTLNLVNLTGANLAKMGADSSVTSGRDREDSMTWSRAIFEHPQKVDGIIYKLRCDNNKKGIALFKNASTKRNLSFSKLGTLLDDVDLLNKILTRYDFSLI